MLPSEKVAKGYLAICEEAEKLQKLDLPEEVQKGLKNIILIAKHQNDIRGMEGGHCCSSKKEGGCCH